MKKRTGLIATKIGNSSYFNDLGQSLPVTILKIDECIVSDVKTDEKNGYTAVQLISIDGKKEIKKVKKPQQKLFADLNINPKKVLKEFRVDSENLLELGSNLNVSHFKQDQFVDVTSVSIGKGFAGAMKSHNFGGLEHLMVFQYRTDLTDQQVKIKILVKFLKVKKWQVTWVLKM